MDIKKVSHEQNFNGNVIVKSKISTAQNYLFSRHKSQLEQMIKDLPFDLYVKQSKSKKTISISAGVENAEEYIVRKNQQNFEEVANFAIADGKKSKLYKTSVKVNELFEYQKAVLMNIMEGKYKQARIAEKALAKKGVENFEEYKLIPHVILNGASEQMRELYQKNSLKYMLYRLFTRKTPDEKQFLKLRKNYYNELKAKGEKVKTVEIELPYYLR